MQEQVNEHSREIAVAKVKIAHMERALDEINGSLKQLVILHQQHTEIESSLKSMHRRIDTWEKAIEGAKCDAGQCMTTIRVQKIEDSLGKLVWIIITALTLAVLASVVKGVSLL